MTPPAANTINFIDAYQPLVMETAEERDNSEAWVHLIGLDDESRKELALLLGEAGLCVRNHASGHHFLSRRPQPDIACAIVGFVLPDMQGLEFQQFLKNVTDPPSVIFLASEADARFCIHAMKQGAADCLLKPLRGAEVTEVVAAALLMNSRYRQRQHQRTELNRRLSTLTPRELEVFRFVVAGYLNKQAAAELRIAENTFQVHRGRVMRKMRATSLPDLVRMSTQLAEGQCDPLVLYHDRQSLESL